MIAKRSTELAYKAKLICIHCEVLARSTVAPWPFHVPFGRVRGMSSRLGNVLLLRHIIASTTELVKQSLLDTKSAYVLILCFTLVIRVLVGISKCFTGNSRVPLTLTCSYESVDER